MITTRIGIKMVKWTLHHISELVSINLIVIYLLLMHLVGIDVAKLNAITVCLLIFQVRRKVNAGTYLHRFGNALLLTLPWKVNTY